MGNIDSGVSSREVWGLPVVGQGLQYKVYDVGGDRVFKQTNSYEEQEAILRSWGTSEEEIPNLIANANEVTVKSSRTIRNLIDKLALRASIVGNPDFESDTDYTQDKTESVREYIGNHSPLQNERVIDDYIALTHELWRSGVADTAFNFSLNNGLAKDGSLVQIDFGEAVFDPVEMEERLRNQSWLQKDSFLNIPPDLQAYVKRKFAEEFTLEKLKALWPDNQPYQ